MSLRKATLFGHKLFKQIGFESKTVPQFIFNRFLSESSISERVLSAVQLIWPQNNGTSEQKLTLDSHLIDNLGLDTSDHIQIIESLEEEFQMEISDNDAKHLMRPKDIVQYINLKEEIHKHFMNDANHKNAFINLNY
jgi:acyl carrier protein